MYKISKQEIATAISQADAIASLIIDSQAGFLYYKVFEEFLEKTAQIKVNRIEPTFDNKEKMRIQLAEMLAGMIDIASSNE